MPERLYAAVHGRVQGVGYRDFVQRHAIALRLVGSVRNRADGTVEVVAEGERGRLESLLRELQAGPRLAAVDRIETEWGDARGELRDFRVTC